MQLDRDRIDLLGCSHVGKHSANAGSNSSWLGASLRRAVLFQREMAPPGIIAAAPKGHKRIPRVERHHGSKRKPRNDDKRERLVADFSELARKLSELKRRTDRVENSKTEVAVFADELE